MSLLGLPDTRRKKIWIRLFTSFLILTLISGASSAAWLTLAVLRAARAVSPVHFNQGLTALVPHAPPGWTNRWCGSCHSREYEQWAESRHFLSGVNDNFRAQFRDEEGGRKQWCLNCHAPANPGTELMPTTLHEEFDQLFQSPPQWLSNGVDCLACHVRDGKVLVTMATEPAEKAHPVRLAPELGTPEFCAGCHQFRFKQDNLPDSFFGQYQQASLSEFLAFRAEVGPENRCHDCHMPQKNHLMPGGYSSDMLNRAVGLELSAEWVEDRNMIRVSVVVSARRVGHRVPGGEYFRFLTLHTTLADASGVTVARVQEQEPDIDEALSDGKIVTSWPQVETMRRLIGPFEKEWPDPSAKPLPDTRLWPGERRRFTYLTTIDPAQVAMPIHVRAEVWYHVLDEDEAHQFGFQSEQVQRMLRSDEVSVSRR